MATFSENAILGSLSLEDHVAFARAKRETRIVVKERRALNRLEGDKFVSAAIHHLRARLSWEKRAAEMLSLIRDKPPEILWRIFLEVWSGCDSTWKFQIRFLKILKIASISVPPTSYLSEDAREFLRRLPSDFTVFRGCSRSRVKGLWWSTDSNVATVFAKGHRGIPFPDPVLATAKIGKKDILAAFTGRDESEIICAPSRILSVEDIKTWPTG
jgi:hypothetical protein